MTLIPFNAQKYDDVKRGPKPVVVVPKFCECGDHAFAPVGNYVTLVSVEDSHLLERAWHANLDRSGAARAVRSGPRVDGKQPLLTLSRVVAGDPVGLVVDHANRDTMDNRRPNLRPCTILQNNVNSVRHKRDGLPRGVRKKDKYFEAWVRFDGKRRYIGTFKTPEAASAAYAVRVVEIYGQFARTV